MFHYELRPRFNDTDGLGHINNASVATWFEESRRPIFEIFIPDLDPAKWSLILARIEIDYKRQLHYSRPVKIETGFLKLGNSSMQVLQRAYQDGELGAEGLATMVHFDYQGQTSKKIPDSIRERLSEHILS